MPSEKVHIGLLKQGNRETFRTLFRHYYPRLKAYALTLIGEDAPAEDIVQDTFLYVWEHRTHLSADDSLQAYLYRLVYTRCMDHFRKMQMADRYCSEVYEEYLHDCQELLQTEGTAFDELFTKDFYQRLYELVELLPAQRREVFLLAYIEGRKAKEIAEKLQMPVRTVESHLYLALKFLKSKMTKRDFYLLLWLPVLQFLVSKAC
ncbi:RNA polymerase subunit sigma-70 [Parabacteroides sp. An277]|uniref:RNA polymerase sigma-70 factor n=1 Tax=Parabacteroides sp. An277 TaxID=1965619 RepID=UPI000B3AD2CB|nr:RNA polymerase sigma-70 factor [Parabacteroides sp. An277]OUO52354.1 RNA polymerase subunit sigma-70 [Parabacteroides sp. An277]